MNTATNPQLLAIALLSPGTTADLVREAGMFRRPQVVNAAGAQAAVMSAGRPRQSRRVPEQFTGRTGEGPDVHAVLAALAQVGVLPAGATVAPPERAVHDHILRAVLSQRADE